MLLSWVNAGAALEPHQVLVVANRKAAESVGLARYYMERRGIPGEHLVSVWTADREHVSREAYEKDIAGPIRRHLEENDPKGRIRCLVIVRGVPLKVAPPELTAEERAERKRLLETRDALRKRLEAVAEKESREAEEIRDALGRLRKELQSVEKGDQGASVDSELTLLLSGDYPLSGWIPNPLFLPFQRSQDRNLPQRVLMVSRLDGPTPEIVKRVIDDSLSAEREGLEGIAYFDARWPRPDPEAEKKQKGGYAFYDASIHRAAERMKAAGRLPVVIDDTKELFPPGECPEAALYCGWYRLARYVPAFAWKRGAVGFHIASSECATLRAGSSQVWCKRMLEEGVAATIGPVGEPYVQAFPIPELFFGLLTEGRWTLAESTFYSLPFLSWQMVLVGDPLYRPFAASADK